MPTPFAVKAVITQSGDNSKLIFTDDSNYSTNTDGVTPENVVSRLVAITDSLGQPVATVPMTLQDDNSYSGNIAISKDVYYSFASTFVIPGPVTKNGTTNYVSVGYWNLAFGTVMENQLGDCGCGKNVCSDLNWGVHNKNAAIIFADKGMGALAQASIDAANKFVNNILNG